MARICDQKEKLKLDRQTAKLEQIAESMPRKNPAGRARRGEEPEQSLRRKTEKT